MYAEGLGKPVAVQCGIQRSQCGGGKICGQSWQYLSDSVAIFGTATVTATNLDIRDLSQSADSVKVGDGTSLIDIDTAPTDGETNGGKRLLHTEAWLWGYNGSTWDRLRSDTTNGLDVDVTRVSGNVTVVQPTAASLNATISGTAIVQDGGSSITVDQATAANLNAAVIGAVASDGALGTAYPVIAGMRASTAEPTAVSADGDAGNSFAVPATWYTGPNREALYCRKEPGERKVACCATRGRPARNNDPRRKERSMRRATIATPSMATANGKQRKKPIGHR